MHKFDFCVCRMECCYIIFTDQLRTIRQLHKTGQKAVQMPHSVSSCTLISLKLSVWLHMWVYVDMIGCADQDCMNRYTYIELDIVEMYLY